MNLRIPTQTICIEGTTFGKDHFASLTPTPFFHSDELKKVYLFLHEWFFGGEWLTVKTSGSTGVPKSFPTEKQKMMHSAETTCRFLRLKKGDTALLCMNTDYIGAKMMVVRALVCGLNLLVRPVCGHPLKSVSERIDFAALVPLQVYNSLTNSTEHERLKAIGKLIIGGGGIAPDLQTTLRTFPNEVYSTYGMTETLSHIALRKLNGNNASERYTPLPSIHLSLSDRETLCIDAPSLCSEQLITNDIAKIHPDGTFSILGRADNVVNSGGVKIQLEEVENRLRLTLSDSFALCSLPDEQFGEILVLATTLPFSEWTRIHHAIEELPGYWQPKKIVLVSHIPQTETNKIDRHQLKEVVRNLHFSS